MNEHTALVAGALHLRTAFVDLIDQLLSMRIKGSEEERNDFSMQFESMRRTMVKGEVYGVSPAVVPLVFVASCTVPGSTRVDSLLPGPRGFAWCPAGLQLQDKLHYVVNETPYFDIVGFSWEYVVAEGIPFTLVYTFVMCDDRDVRLSALRVWRGDHSLDEAIAAAPTKFREPMDDRDRDILAWFAAWCAFVNQKVVLVDRHDPTRAQRRQAERRRAAPPPPVYVVHYRRPEQKTVQPDGTPRDWTCQWLVRGHWRHLADGRTLWVRPYVKGPEDKPFRAPRQRVNLVVR